MVADKVFRAFVEGWEPTLNARERLPSFWFSIAMTLIVGIYLGIFATPLVQRALAQWQSIGPVSTGYPPIPNADNPNKDEDAAVPNGTSGAFSNSGNTGNITPTNGSRKTN